MNTIKELKTWPSEATVEAVQVKVARTFEYRTVNTANGQKTVQAAELVDGAGEKIRISAWEHPDLKALEGKEVVLHSNKSGNGKFGGVVVKHGSYTNKSGVSVATIELSVSKLGTFQLVEVFKANGGSGATQPSTQASEPVKSQGNGVSGAPTAQYVHGATVGMAINQACQNLTHLGNDLTEDDVWRLASRLIRVAQKLEAGNLAPEVTND